MKWLNNFGGSRVIAAASVAAVLLMAALLSSTPTLSNAFAMGVKEPEPPKPTMTEYSGQATAVLVETGLIDVKLGDTGPLPSTGGFLEGTVVKVNLDVVQADILKSKTMGINNVAQSEAATADVNILAGTITADLIEAESKAVCDDAFGSSNIVNLKVKGVSVIVTGDPNQEIDIPLVGKLIINEQIKSEINGKHEITVNALHLKLNLGGHVIVSSAYSDIKCGDIDPSKVDHIDGDGAIKVDDDNKAHFDFSVGFKLGEPGLGGYFNYEDPANDVKVESTKIVEYKEIDDKTRQFAGFAKVNGMTGIWFAVWASDNGTPGNTSAATTDRSGPASSRIAC